MLPAKQATRGYGMFGYEGDMVDGAIRGDRLIDLQECIKLGYVEPTSYVMGARSVLDLCIKKGATKCAAYLRKEGWPEYL